MKFDSSPSFLKTLRGRKSRKVKASGHCAAWDAFFFSETHIAIPLRAASLAVSKITRNSLSQSPDFGLCKLQQAGIFLRTTLTTYDASSQLTFKLFLLPAARSRPYSSLCPSPFQLRAAGGQCRVRLDLGAGFSESKLLCDGRLGDLYHSAAVDG